MPLTHPLTKEELSALFLLNSSGLIAINYYDRIAITIGQLYNANGVAPHGLTTRWIYTVPAGKKALVETSICRILRITAAAALSFCDARIITGGLTTAQTYSAYALLLNNTINAQITDRSDSPILLLAGQTLSGETNDGSTGGTMNYLVTAKITEFNA